MKILIFISILLLISSCATMNKEECLGANWTTRGEVDGRSGKEKNHFQKYNEACSEHGIKVKQSDYLSGWESGIISFCTKDNGFAQGKSGQSNERVCPNSLQPIFNKGYTYGRKIYELERDIKSAEDDIRRIDEKIADLYRLQASSNNSNTNSDIWNQRSERGRHERKLRNLRRQLTIYETTQIVKDLMR